VFDRIDEIGPGIRFLSVPRLDLDERQVMLADLEDVADGHGRGALLDEARARVRDGLMMVTGAQPHGFWNGQELATGGNIEDQVAQVLAIEDLVAVAVVEDLLEADVAAALASPGLRMLGMPLPQADDGGVAKRPGKAVGVEGDEVARDELAEAAPAGDDASAEEAALAAEELAALRQRRAVVFVAVLAVALPIGVAGGLGWASLALFVLAALFVAWLFA
jgi:hypothetical protein